MTHMQAAPYVAPPKHRTLSQIFATYRTGDHLESEELDLLATAMERVAEITTHLGDLYALPHAHASEVARNCRSFLRARGWTRPDPMAALLASRPKPCPQCDGTGINILGARCQTCDGTKIDPNTEHEGEG